MKISVIIASHNEKQDLETTATLAAYGSVRPHEIIVVDDYSDPPVGDRLDRIERLSVIRTPKQLGPSQSIRFGTSKATGDVFVLLDSHMRMPDWWLHAIQCAVEDHPSAIMCATCCEFDYRYNKDFICAGAKFRPEKDAIELEWESWDECKEIVIRPAILGACYIIPTPLWNALGGINPNFTGWGMEEQDLSIRAWMCGFEVRVIKHLVVSHRWNRTALSDEDAKGTWQETISQQERNRICITGNMMNSWRPGYNQIVTCATVFENGLFEQLQDALKARWTDSRIWHSYFAQEAEIARFRKRVQNTRIRSDEEIVRIIGEYRPGVET